MVDYETVYQSGVDTVLTGVSHFDLAQTLDCGQAFRWGVIEANADDAVGYTGIAYNRRLNLTFVDGVLTLHETSLEEFEAVWKEYFDFTRSYGDLRVNLSRDCAHLSRAMEFSPGLRLMRQDVWEILVSFILSQNSNIPRIKKMISALCENFGERLSCGGYAFPAAEALAILSPKDLNNIKSGYRAAYIIDAARRTAEGSFDIRELQKLESDEVHEALLKIHGVGPKVAECVLLFGFGRIERFPLDVWMKRVMAGFYPQGFPPQLQPYSGIAQQFLFHYARTTGLTH